jgi:peptide-methionine (S)-S-oxide reductase
MEDHSGIELATFGAGCFWCTEAVFLTVKGVTKVVSGYSGGTIKNPSYREICTGETGHAEVTQISFNSRIVTFEELLEVFWNTHDPTTLNKQGADEGTQYRSVVFFHSIEQQKAAAEYKLQLEESKIYRNPIVTEISPITIFYPAEAYHQNYFELNPTQSYCQYVVRPKVEKFKKQFANKLKN